MKRLAIAIASTLTFASVASAQNAIPVTVDNFPRAETDHYLTTNTKEAGGIGKLHHNREATAIDNQTVIRMNRDSPR
jgi:hypothetical protein